MLDERYIRNLNALSESDCNTLFDKRVLIAGCGGLGGYVVEALARIGVGHLTVIDSDKFQANNLNRQLLADMQTIGKSKVEVACAHVAAINPDVELNAFKEHICRDNCIELSQGFDVIIDCLDNYQSRFWLAHGAEENNTPIIFGGIAGWYGQVSCIYPGDTTFVDIYGSMEDGESASQSQGNLSFCAGFVANVQASQAIGVLLEHDTLLRNKILMVDLLNSSFEILDLG